MFKKQDPYSYTNFLQLSAHGSAIGILAVEYRVALYDDVEVNSESSTKLPSNQQFDVYCTQRLFVTNPGNSSVAPITGSTIETQYFANYPALIQTLMKINQATGVVLRLLDYSPHTINTAVQTTSSKSDGTGNSTETSNSSTTGNSQTQTSTYGTSISGGIGSPPSFSYSHESSASSTTENSATSGKSSGSSSSSESNIGSSMSVKDWGSYGSVNPYYSYPTWVFGQEYPWSAIDCRYTGTDTYPGTSGSKPNANQFRLNISNSMVANLFDQSFLYPPSELSMFGINFVMKCQWRVYVEDTASTTVTMTHDVSYFSASHLAIKTDDDPLTYTPAVYLEKEPATLLTSADATGHTFSVQLDLNVMALDPLGVNARAAIVGFLPRKFIPAAKIEQSGGSATLPKTFKTIAATNDLIVENKTAYGNVPDSGFSVSQASMTASWSDVQNLPYTLYLYFKVTDAVTEYALNMKHWITQSTGVELSIVVNDDESNAITRYVTSREGEGGDDNFMSLALRDLNFSSIDYHDYLQLGLNVIAIAMKPIDENWSAGCGYQIRAISVSRS